MKVKVSIDKNKKTKLFRRHMISIGIKAVWNLECFFNSCRNMREVSITISSKSEKKIIYMRSTDSPED